MPPIRGIVLAALGALTLAGCGASGEPTQVSGAFTGCALGPPWPLLVLGGSLAALSVHGVSCESGVHLATSVIEDLGGRGGADAVRLRVTGWTCFRYGGSQITCTRGGATLYAQYARSS